jgi:cell division protein FtsL
MQRSEHALHFFLATFRFLVICPRWSQQAKVAELNDELVKIKSQKEDFEEKYKEAEKEVGEQTKRANRYKEASEKGKQDLSMVEQEHQSNKREQTGNTYFSEEHSVITLAIIIGPMQAWNLNLCI